MNGCLLRFETPSSDEVEGSRVLGPKPTRYQRKTLQDCGVSSKADQPEGASGSYVDEPEMSRILHYKIERYTIDRLVGYLEILYPKVNFEVFAA